MDESAQKKRMSTVLDAQRKAIETTELADYLQTIKKHFDEPKLLAMYMAQNIPLGTYLSDGLTVPFALAAGLSGAVASTGIIVTAGFAEIAAGSIAMGLGGYLAARGDAVRGREAAGVCGAGR